MSFFKKEETGLFIAENGRPAATASPYFEKEANAVEDLDRFNEVETPSKRRRLSGEADAAHGQKGNGSLFGDEEEGTTPAQSAATTTATKSGPFMEDSDSEDDEDMDEEDLDLLEGEEDAFGQLADGSVKKKKAAPDKKKKRKKKSRTKRK